MTSKADIRRWLGEAETKRASHMLVICDTFDWSDYPVYVFSAEEAATLAETPGEMQKIMEIYSLSLDLESQLNEHRARNI